MQNNQPTKLELIQAQVTFIPDGWKLDKVGTALSIKNNFRKPISQEVRSTIQGDYPYYGPTKIQDYISEYEQDGTYALIGEDGDHFLKYSYMPQTQFISGKCTVNNHAHIIESSTKCDSEWFYIFFKHRNITNFLSRQGAGRFKLNKATLEKLPVLVPPLGEQRKIAKILSTWDKAISTTERLIDNSKQQKKALMQQLLTGQKRLLDDSGKAFDGEWEESKLGELITEFVNGYAFTASNYKSHGIPIITMGNISLDGSFNERQLKQNFWEDDSTLEKYKIKFGDLLIAMTDVTPGKNLIGRMTIVDIDKTFYLNQRVGLLKLNDKADSIFLKYLSNESKWRKYSIAVSASGVQANMSTKDIKKGIINLPSIEEQRKIAAVLTNADKEIDLLEQQLADLKQEKKALMQQLLTGKRRVKIDDKEVA